MFDSFIEEGLSDIIADERVHVVAINWFNRPWVVDVDYIRQELRRRAESIKQERIVDVI